VAYFLGATLYSISNALDTYCLIMCKLWPVKGWITQ